MVRSARKKFGLLEKHKDYVQRAKAFHKKEDTLRVQFHALFIKFKFSFLRFNHFFNLLFFYRNSGKKQLIEMKTSFTSRWLEQKPSMEFTDQSNWRLATWPFRFSVICCCYGCVILLCLLTCVGVKQISTLRKSLCLWRRRIWVTFFRRFRVRERWGLCFESFLFFNGVLCQVLWQCRFNWECFGLPCRKLKG